MYRDAVVLHSKSVGDDIDLIVYGEKGYPVIVFQTQNSPATNYEDFGMVDELSSYINDGKIQLFSVGNIDAESWMATDKDKSKRSQRQEDYFKFVTDEMVPYVHERNNSELRPLTTGCALGATHAAIAVMRRPDLFQGCIALSGVYRTSFYYGDWMDSNLYLNDIIVSLRNLPQDHPYVNLYNHRQLVFCVGQGAWEDGIDDLRTLDSEFKRLGIQAWCDFWGFDVNHDWPWWKKQIQYFLPIVLEDVKKELASEKPAEKKAEAPKAAAPKETPKPEAPKATPKPAVPKPEPEPKVEPAKKAEPAKMAAKPAEKKAAPATKTVTAAAAPKAEKKAAQPAIATAKAKPSLTTPEPAKKIAGAEKHAALDTTAPKASLTSFATAAPEKKAAEPEKHEAAAKKAQPAKRASVHKSTRSRSKRKNHRK